MTCMPHTAPGSAAVSAPGATGLAAAVVLTQVLFGPASFATRTRATSPRRAVSACTHMSAGSWDRVVCWTHWPCVADSEQRLEAFTCWVCTSLALVSSRQWPCSWVVCAAHWCGLGVRRIWQQPLAAAALLSEWPFSKRVTSATASVPTAWGGTRY